MREAPRALAAAPVPLSSEPDAGRTCRRLAGEELTHGAEVSG
jgi:hypothetical protein